MFIRSFSRSSRLFSSRSSCFSTFSAASRKKNINANIFDYRALIDAEFENLQQFLAPILNDNNYKLDVSEKYRIVLDCGVEGTYEFRAVLENFGIVCNFPIAGCQLFYFDEVSKRWLGSNHKNDLYGTVIRDLLRHAHGLPDMKFAG